MVSRSRVRRVNLYAIPQLLPILLPKALVWIRWHMYRTFLDSIVQLCSISHFHLKMWVMSFLQSNSFEKKQVSTSLHRQSATPDYQTFLRLLTLPWTGTPAVIESGLAPVSQHPITTRRAKSQQSTSPNFVPCSTPGGVGTSRKVPVPDRLILFTERRHVGGEEKHKCRYCRPQICKL